MLSAANLKDTFKNFTEALKEVYDVDEANAIARIYFEDALNIKPAMHFSHLHVLMFFSLA